MQPLWQRQTPSTGLRHPSFGGRCRKAMLGVCGRDRHPRIALHSHNGRCSSASRSSFFKEQIYGHSWPTDFTEIVLVQLMSIFAFIIRIQATHSTDSTELLLQWNDHTIDHFRCISGCSFSAVSSMTFFMGLLLSYTSAHKQKQLRLNFSSTELRSSKMSKTRWPSRAPRP